MNGELNLMATPDGVSPVDIYVDFSNVFWGARAHAERIGETPGACRLEAERLFLTLAAVRPVRTSILVANARLPENVRRRFERWFEVVTAEPGALTGREAAADEVLQNRMLLDFTCGRAPGVVVLATGDGAGWRRGLGFARVLRVARQVGHGVEVAAFDETVNPLLVRLTHLTRGAFVDLGAHYRSITFLEGMRLPEPVNLRHRPTAAPHPWEPGELDRLLEPADEVDETDGEGER